MLTSATRLSDGKVGASFEKIPANRVVTLDSVNSLRAHVDFACMDVGGGLAVIGWVFDPEHIVRGFVLLSKEREGLLRKNYSISVIKHGADRSCLSRISRPDVVRTMSADSIENGEQHGFVLAIPYYSEGMSLGLVIGNGRYVRLPFTPLRNPVEIRSALQPHWLHSGTQLLKALQASLGEDGALTQLVSSIGETRTIDDIPHLPLIVEEMGTVFAAVDRAYPLGEAGVLIFGWKFMPRREPVSVTLLDDKGGSVDVTHRFTTLFRADVAAAYRPRFPQINDWLGFACLAPLATHPDEARALCFDFGTAGREYLRVPTEKRDIGGVDLVREMLNMVHNPDRVRHKLYDLFSTSLGRAVEAVNHTRSPFQGKIEERQFGVANEQAEISVIIPLYGRYDFLRYQLAQFADDADFSNVDLIYVLDDPHILVQTLELAARYQGLFRLPFRVVWYGANRGFAGANNIGARVAHGGHLLLMNSDVIPQHPGWIKVLKRALDSLPDAGAVGPLLQFGDNSIQHAGMYPRRDPLLPGFILNSHKGMGMTWEGGNEPSERPMMTAACLMLRKQDFLALGGFDEGYVTGDFEDSDLCLSLRRLGMRLWLVPEARLWHLERQSKNLGGMMTLFNGWRYSEKIRSGLLVAPTMQEGEE